MPVNVSTNHWWSSKTEGLSNEIEKGTLEVLWAANQALVVICKSFSALTKG